MEIRNATVKDLSDIVRIHCSAFAGFFLTSLGSNFLHFYYKCFILSNETVTLVATDCGNIVGFSAATKTSRGFNSRLIKQNYFNLSTIVQIFVHFTQITNKIGKKLSKKITASMTMRTMLIYIQFGVAANQQGKAVGKQLLATCEVEMSADI